MKSSQRNVVLFVEEGAAFAELEGRHLGLSRKETPMNSEMHHERQREHEPDEHFAPVEAWNAIARGYDSYVTPGEADVAKSALKLTGLEAGQTFLDVAAGTGGLSLPAARLGAKVTATDWSPRMVELFEARARKEGFRDAVAKVMDCHELGFPDDTFDNTGSQFGVMLVPDQPKALREMVRVTKPGGHVLLIAYGPPAKFEGLQIFIDALRRVNPAFEGMPSDPPPLEFQVSDPEVMRARLTAAGLRNVTVNTQHQERLELRSGEDLWNWSLGSNPIPNMLTADLSVEQKSAMRARLDETIRARANAHGVAVLTAPLNIGIGTK